MKDWILTITDYILSNWQTVLTGGIYAVSIVIFVLGCLKPLIKRWVGNSTLRKVIFAWLSVLLNVPATALSFWVEEFPSEHFWTLMVVNTIGTILVYFVYENTALRNALHWFGKKLLTILFTQFVSPTQTKKELKKEVEELLANPTGKVETIEKSANSRYNDDLKI